MKAGGVFKFMICKKSTLVPFLPLATLALVSGSALFAQNDGPEDWSHKHLIFSNPGTLVDAVRNGAVDKWQTIVNDPRFRMQEAKRKGGPKVLVNKPGGDKPGDDKGGNKDGKDDGPLKKSGPAEVIHRDWGKSMGTGAAAGAAVYPAKYSFGISAANCDTATTPDFVVYPTKLLGAATTSASNTGTFSATTTPAAGTVLVNGVTLTASSGTAATRNGTVGATAWVGGETVSVNGTTMTASTPVKQVDQIAFATTGPANGTSLVIGGITYAFVTTPFGAPGTTTCNIAAAGTASASTANLSAAITTAGSNGNSSTTWRCGGSATQPTSGVTVTGITSPNVQITAKIAGSTGFTSPTSITNATVTVTTAASDGSATAPNFQIWSGTASLGTNAIATNIRAVINATLPGVVVASASTGTVTVTAGGTAGNSVALATTAAAGKFGWAGGATALTGGTDGTNTGTSFATDAGYSGNVAGEATNLAAAIARQSGIGVTATSSLGVVTVTASTAGVAGNSIMLTLGTLTTFTWAGTTLTGGAENESIVAYDNLYSSCTGGANSNAIPNVYWQYNTGGTVQTSPILSLDGSQVAFVQSESNVAHLIVLKWSKSSTVATLTSTAAASYRACTAPCMTDLGAFSGAAVDDTTSSPFYVYYGSDTLYVGDDAGKLHRFTGIFNGTPAESGSPFPVALGSTVLSSPVWDAVSQKVFVGDRAGFLYSVTSGGTKVTSGQIAASSSTGIADAPLVDSATGRVFAFVEDNIAGTAAAVYQFATGFTGGTTGTAVTLNSSVSTTIPMYAGTFDNQYYTTGTGGLLVCVGANSARLSRIAVTSGGAMTFTAGNTLASGATTCSSVSEILSVNASTTLNTGGSALSNSATTVPISSGTGFANNDYIQIDSEIMTFTGGGGTTSLTGVTRGALGTTAVSHSNSAVVTDIHDRVYASVTALGNATGCSGACIYMTDVTAGAVPASANAGLPVAGGTSGVIIDNSVIGTGDSQLYFTALGNTAATTLNGAITTATSPITVTSGTGFNNGDYIKIDAEILQISSGGGTTSLTVTRGALSTAASHVTGAGVIETCGTTGTTGGCAIQASQAALN